MCQSVAPVSGTKIEPDVSLYVFRGKIDSGWHIGAVVSTTISQHERFDFPAFSLAVWLPATVQRHA